MQSTLVALGIETFKIALYLSLPMLLSGLIDQKDKFEPDFKF